MSKAELSDRLNALQESSPPDEGLGDVREKELQAVLHELEVYQIELEMQVRELKESRLALEESHARYVDLYDFAPVGYVTLSDQGTIQEINLTAAGMLGVERRWLKDRSLAPWVLGADLKLFRAHLKQCSLDSGQVKSNIHLVSRDMRVIPVELTTSCFSDLETGSMRMRTAITDLTERRGAEADLDRFFNLSTDLLCILGTDGRFKRVNPACLGVLGYGQAELVGRSFMDFLHPDDRDSASAELVRAGREGATTANFQSRYVRKDRRVIWLSWSSMTSGGMVYGVGRDITGEIEAKGEIESYVKKLKEERNLRERFVSTLTHDLRTPLTAARVSAQLLERQSKDPSTVVTLSKHIIKGIDRTDHMIRDLLDANRIRAGEELPMKLTEFDLAELVRGTLEDLAAVHGNRFLLRAKAPVIGQWSRNDLRRVVENLVNNAIKYGDPNQKVTVTVLQERSLLAVLSVRNYGNPIPKEEQSTLFRQFRRSPDAEKSGAKGWGLGLTLVRGIVEAHGGEVDVESSVREGTTFRVELPLRGIADNGG